MPLKGDIVNRMYSKLRISGLTKQPSPEDNSLALGSFETMMAEFEKREICLNYNFEDIPDMNTPHTVERGYWTAVEFCLGYRVIVDFGKVASDILISNSMSSFSFLAASTAKVKDVSYPPRHPRGSGNMRYSRRFHPYYFPAEQAPVSCETNTMYVGDINNYVEHFDSDLQLGETIASYILTADTGLTVAAESLSTPDVDYTISAVGSTNSNQLLRVKIVATTSTGRVITRLIDFELLVPPTIS